MNPLPILALVAVAGTYSMATERLNQDFAPKQYSQAEQVVYYPGGSDDLSVYSLMERVAPSLDSPRCEAQAQMASILARDFSEHPVENRVIGDGLQVVLWGSTEMGTWTLVHNGDDGVACVVSSGTGWTDLSSADEIFSAAPLSS